MNLKELTQKLNTQPRPMYGDNEIERDGIKFTQLFRMYEFPVKIDDPKIAEEVRNLSSAGNGGMFITADDKGEHAIVQTVKPLSQSAREYVSNFLKQLGLQYHGNLPNY